MNAKPPRFDEAALRERCEATTGLCDWGDPGFEEPLQVLLASYREAPLHDAGAGLLERSLLRSLGLRLRLVDWLRRYPEIEDEEIRSPIIVVGMMRSGTTLMQRLLAAHPDLLCTFGWEALEPVPREGFPSESPDPRIESGRQRDATIRRYTPELFAIHPSEAEAAEEEIIFLADAFLSHVPEASAHLPLYRSWIDQADFTPAYRHLRQVLQCLQWQKRARGAQARRWVLKSPAHLGYLETLLTAFPGAHVVHMHRDPRASIASGASLNRVLWKMHSDTVESRVVGSQWLERMHWASQRALESRKRLPEHGFTDIRFDELARAPLDQVARVCAAAGLPTGDAPMSAVRAWQEADRDTPHPTHHYELGEFGLEGAAVDEMFVDYRRAFLEAPHGAETGERSST